MISRQRFVAPLPLEKNPGQFASAGCVAVIGSKHTTIASPAGVHSELPVWTVYVGNDDCRPSRHSVSLAPLQIRRANSLRYGGLGYIGVSPSVVLMRDIYTGTGGVTSGWLVATNGMGNGGSSPISRRFATRCGRTHRRRWPTLTVLCVKQSTGPNQVQFEFMRLFNRFFQFLVCALVGGLLLTAQIPMPSPDMIWASRDFCQSALCSSA